MLAMFVTMTDMMTVSEDLASACKNSDSFDDDREESLLEYPSFARLKGWKAGLVWVSSSSIPRGIVCGMLKPATDFCFKASEVFEWLHQLFWSHHLGTCVIWMLQS